MSQFIVHSVYHPEPRRDLAYRDQDNDRWVYSEAGGGWTWDEECFYPWPESASTPEHHRPHSFPWTTTLPDGDTRQWQYKMPNPDLETVVATSGGGQFVVKDSGVREEYANGFVRDTEDGKEDFTRLFGDPAIHAQISRNPGLLDFLATNGAALIPHELLIRWAEHMHKGARKYGEDNWRQARGTVAVARFARSFCRHAVQWLRGDRDEDHAVAIMFNVAARELTPSDEEVTESESP